MATMTSIPITEDTLLGTVIEMAARLSVRTAHFRAAQAKSGRWLTAVQGDGKGFPDLVLAGPSGVLFRELKSAEGRLSVEQQAWLDALATAGGDVAVWRPSDLFDGRIEAEIRALHERRPA